MTRPFFSSRLATFRFVLGSAEELCFELTMHHRQGLGYVGFKTDRGRGCLAKIILTSFAPKKPYGAY